MAISSSPADFSIAQKVLHWLMAAAIILDLFVAQKFGGVMEEWDRIESRSDHATLGTIVAMLFAIRLYLRLRHGAPALPMDLPKWQTGLAHAAHWALYGLMGLLIASGMAAAFNADSLISPFGLFSYGDGTGDAPTFLTVRLVHEFATNAIIALIILHAIAAVYHLAIKNHRSLTLRMLKFWQSGGQPS